MSNPYGKSPLCISAVDPLSGRYTRSFHFLGAAPRAVLEAARRGKAAHGDPRAVEWSAADRATLRGHYGPRWRDALTGADPPRPYELEATAATPSELIENYYGAELWTGTSRDVLGGGPLLDFGDLMSITNLADPSLEQAGPDSFVAYDDSSLSAPESETGPPVYSEMAIYEEDTIYDLRLKLSAVSGIPFYRAHLFFYVNGEGPILPYNITISGAPISTAWNEIRQRDSAAGFTSIAGVTVDTQAVEQRDAMRVEALDTFMLLSPQVGVRVTAAYFVDLYSLLPPLSARERPKDNLSAVLSDRYQFDLLYYGALVKYWPQLSPDACLAALTNPERMKDYPDLAPDQNRLKSRFAAEKALTEASLKWRPGVTKGMRPTLAVTQATVGSHPSAARMRVAVRNVFDWLPVTAERGAAAVLFAFDAPDLSGPVTVAASKRHSSSFGGGSNAAIEAFAERARARDTAAYALAREPVGDDLHSIPYAYLTIHGDGRYEASADWREDDRIGFEAVVDELGSVVSSTVREVNAMSAMAFPIGGELAPLGRGRLSAITVSVFWPHALTSDSFRALKDRFRVYERAGIVNIRGLQQAGAYALIFRKGVVNRYNYDRNMAVNQYLWLTDPAFAAKWSSYNAGRVVRIYHRATDIRVEIVGATSVAEFEMIRRYIFSFLDGLLTGTGRLPTVGRLAAPEHEPTSESTAASRRLRRLQERDPNLFDLKKYDASTTVYSRLCQSDRQPHVYNEAERRQLSARKKAAAVRYWNFTDGVPAYYSCPDPAYPSLSFQSGQHPLGYCLPCCKKTMPARGSRAALTNEGCLATPNAATAANASLSRHILAYGKAVPVGRLAEIPRELNEGLFLDALPAPYTLQLVGVEQAVPAVSNAGWAYALAYIVSELAPESVFETIGRLVESMQDTFQQLAGGRAAVFPSAAALADALLGAFVRHDEGFSPLGHGGEAEEFWPLVLIELISFVYGVETVVFNDPEGVGSMMLEVSPHIAAAMARNSGTLAVLISGPAGVYPMVAVDGKAFLRAPTSERSGIVRKVFSATPDDNFVADNVAPVLYNMVQDKITGARTSRLPDLDTLQRFLASSGAYSYSILVDMHDRCYGAVIQDEMYIPVRYSSYMKTKDSKIHYGVRPGADVEKDRLMAFIEQLNAFMKKAKLLFDQIRPDTILTSFEDRVVGFRHSAGDESLYFFHKSEPAGEKSGEHAMKLMYDTRHIDAAIVAAARGASAPPRTALQADIARGRNRLYRLFIAEFASTLRGDRDTKLRKAIASAVEATDFNALKSATNLRAKLYDLLHGFPDDLVIIRAAIAKAYVASPRNTARAAMETINATVFGFDHHTLHELQSMPSHGETVAAVRAIMAPHVLAVKEVQPPPNIYVSCSDIRGQQCSGKKLAVPEDRLDDMYDILAADVRNRSKTGLLSSVPAGIFDPLEFIRRPGEHLTVAIIS